MKLKINNQETLVSIFHLNNDEFCSKFPELAKHSPKKSKKVTVAEVTYDNCHSVASSHVHKNDQFNRRQGSINALERALHQHPTLSQRGNKQLRTEIFEKMFRSEPSPYDQLDKMVRGKPDLVRELIQVIENKTS